MSSVIPDVSDGRMRRALTVCVALCAMVAVSWLAPLAWFRSKQPGVRKLCWQADRVPHGWQSNPEPISPEIRSSLGAEVAYSGILARRTGEGRQVRAFLAVHGKEAVEGSSFFSHTPDRCWPAAGWSLERALPEQVRIVVQGSEFIFERRVFIRGGARELVYFGAIVDGQPFAGRMDHYLDYAERSSARAGGDGVRRVIPRLEVRALAWLNSIVKSRVRLDGAAQFLRISTPVEAGTVAEGDRFLASFVQEWPEVRRAP